MHGPRLGTWRLFLFQINTLQEKDPARERGRAFVWDATASCTWLCSYHEI